LRVTDIYEKLGVMDNTAMIWDTEKGDVRGSLSVHGTPIKGDVQGRVNMAGG
jgi:hypothetical protein